MLRKTVIIGCITTLYSYGERVQVTAIQFVLVTCMSTELIIEPFAKKEARDLERLSLVIQIFSFICTGFFQSPGVNHVVLEILFFCVNAAFVGFFLYGVRGGIIAVLGCILNRILHRRKTADKTLAKPSKSAIEINAVQLSIYDVSAADENTASI